ncbi:hypothetical protein A33M_3400 [Rhodovulum sp. PH10]|nr:hypothetical protein A33M_3400 [Rhodovulum sp. PH10]
MGIIESIPVVRRSRPATSSNGLPEPKPDREPVPGPAGPRTPYPVNDPGIAQPDKPGAEPDYVPPTPPGGPGQM